MAEKRMFSKSVIDSDAFTSMPMSAQCLYFHLGMNADDEGFLNNAKKIQASIRAKDSDMNALIEKRYILQFASGVTAIKHWYMHNTLRRDRFTPTAYTDERNCLIIKENRTYTEKDAISSCEIINSKLPQQKKKSEKLVNKNNQTNFDIFWELYPRKVNKQKAFELFTRINPDDLEFENIKDAVLKQSKSKQWTCDDGKFIPHPTTWLNGRRWQDETTVDIKKNMYEGEL